MWGKPQMRLALHVFTVVLFGLFLGCASHAAPARPMAQAPGYFRYPVGDFVVTALNDGMLNPSLSGLQGVSAKQIHAITARAFYPDATRGPISVNAYIVDTGEHRILVDSGTAKCFGSIPSVGFQPANLRASGYAPEDIDIILITHLHGDHFCALATDDGKRAYPNATVWVAQEELAYWLDPKIAAAQPANQQQPFQQARDVMGLYQAAGALRTLKPGEAILPGVTARATHGHTPGHTSYLFTSKGQSLLVWGDIVVFPEIQLAYPQATINSDVDAKQAAATRRALLTEMTASGGAIAGAHLPFPGIGHIRKDGNGYAWVPALYRPLVP
jgi:glyoxylase-like metal-dependent hydrolase (beta-lactamase superfamily II)